MPSAGFEPHDLFREREVLYQLSYEGMVGVAGLEPTFGCSQLTRGTEAVSELVINSLRRICFDRQPTVLGSPQTPSRFSVGRSAN